MPSHSPTKTKSFQVIKVKGTWQAGRQQCILAGGDLATIRNSAEQSLVKAEMDATYNPAEWGSDWPYV